MEGSSAKSIPQILSRSDVPLLSEGLDAGDILECYALVRPAPLHNPLLPNAPLTIHKVALGIRYRPLKVNDLADEAKIREITLEYGPQRMGVSLTQESMPSVQKEQGVDETPSSSSSNNNNSNDTDTTGSSFLTWENEGKIYYTTQIASTGYISAYYMASVTGAVLGKILEKAVDYPMENAYIRGRPRRYQPFVVVDGSIDSLPPPGFEGEISDLSNRKVLMKSSNSADFMDYMWGSLAELGVALNPILAPPTYEVQLLATGVEKIKVGPPTWVTHSAASFYDKLYMCIEAKVTGDYSKYVKPTPAPTSIVEAPSQAPSEMEMDPALNSNTTSEEQVPDNDENDDGGAMRFLRADFPGTPEMKETDPPIDAVRDIDEHLTHDNSSTTVLQNFPDAIATGNTTAIHNDDPAGMSMNANPAEMGVSANQSTANVTGTDSSGSSPSPIPIVVYNATDDMTANLSSAPTLSLAPSIQPSPAPSLLKVNAQDTKSEVDEAQEAADQAQQAAAEAKDAATTEVESKAADAAQVAANAAQKAATATNTAAAQSAMDALLSGDGTTIASVLSPCFSDPQFGISTLDENGTLVTYAYLYVDGSSYYKLNLTYPFMQVVPVDRTLPQPRDFGGPGAGGDIVDWVLAIFIFFMSLFGILMLVQQAFGGYIKLIRPLFNWQRWFFNPLHYEDDLTEEEREISQSQQGRGHAHAFAEDVIPVSMGGRRASRPDLLQARQLFRGKTKIDNEGEEERERIPLNGSGEHQEENELSGDVCEIELTEARSPLSLRGFDEVVNRGSSRGSAESGDSGSPLPRVENGGDGGNGVVGNIELIENDHRIRENGLPSRFTRDQNLVEMPNLKSSSKVAIPVGVTRNKSFYSSGGNTL